MLWTLTSSFQNAVYVEVSTFAQRQRMHMSYLVTIAPEEVLCTEVEIWVRLSLLKARAMSYVLPVLVPEPVGIGGGDGKAGDDEADDIG